MKNIVLLLARALLGVALMATAGFVNAAELGAATAAANGIPEYRLHAGDRLDIGVWKEKELTRVVIVSPDGRISYPLVGDLVAGGRTVNDVRTELETRLKKYIPEPVVTVVITGVDGNAAYVIGQVTRPGALIMNPAINVMQALSIAGGGTPFAKLDGIIIIRRSAAGQKVLNFRYGQVSEGKNLEQNIQLEAGDVVVVP